jgi:hypothetical protein
VEHPRFLVYVADLVRLEMGLKKMVKKIKSGSLSALGHQMYQLLI